jgi:hypothetical protein
MTLSEFSASGTVTQDQAPTPGVGGDASVELPDATTTVADEIIFAAVCHNSATDYSSGPTNYTAIQTSVGQQHRILTFYRIVSATGTYGGTVTMSAVSNWVAMQVTLYETIGGGGGGPPKGTLGLLGVGA